MSSGNCRIERKKNNIVGSAFKLRDYCVIIFAQVFNLVCIADFIRAKRCNRGKSFELFI